MAATKADLEREVRVLRRIIKTCFHAASVAQAAFLEGRVKALEKDLAKAQELTPQEKATLAYERGQRMQECNEKLRKLGVLAEPFKMPRED